jgi:hypothetical protein
MPFNYMLWYCLCPGKTSYKEPGTGWGVQVQPASEETILFLLTDSDHLREYFATKRNWYNLKNAADLLVYCSRPARVPILPARVPILLFVELKGSDIHHAAEQLRQTVEAVRNALGNPMRSKTDYRALILASGAAPKNTKAIQKTFRDKYGVALRIKTGIGKGAVDLRPYLKDE